MVSIVKGSQIAEAAYISEAPVTGYAIIDSVKDGGNSATVYQNNKNGQIVVGIAGTHLEVSDLGADLYLSTIYSAIKTTRTDRIDTVLDKLGEKHSNIAVVGHSLGGAIAQSVSGHSSVSEVIAFNLVNESRLKGHGEDLLVLRNATPTAPHVGKNILGYVRFENDSASVCWAHDKPLVDTAVRLTLSKIKKAGGRSSLSRDFCIHLASVENQTFKSSTTCLLGRPLVNAMRIASCLNSSVCFLAMIILLDGYYSIQGHGIKP